MGWCAGDGVDEAPARGLPTVRRERFPRGEPCFAHIATRKTCLSMRTLLYYPSLRTSRTEIHNTHVFCCLCPVPPQLKILGHAKKVKGSVLVEVRPHDRLINPGIITWLENGHGCSAHRQVSLTIPLNAVRLLCLCLKVIRLAKMDPEVDASLDVREVRRQTHSLQQHVLLSQIRHIQRANMQSLNLSFWSSGDLEPVGGVLGRPPGLPAAQAAQPRRPSGEGHSITACPSAHIYSHASEKPSLTSVMHPPLALP